MVKDIRKQADRTNSMPNAEHYITLLVPDQTNIDVSLTLADILNAIENVKLTECYFNTVNGWHVAVFQVTG